MPGIVRDSEESEAAKLSLLNFLALISCTISYTSRFAYNFVRLKAGSTVPEHENRSHCVRKCATLFES